MIYFIIWFLFKILCKTSRYAFSVSEDAIGNVEWVKKNKKKQNLNQVKLEFFTLSHRGEEIFCENERQLIFDFTSCSMHKLICGALGHKIFIEDKNLARDKKLLKLYSKTLDSITEN